MSGLSVEAIRELNKIKFIVECCDDPVGEFSSTTSTSSKMRGQALWSFSLYSSGGFSISGGKQDADTFLKSFMKGNSAVNFLKQAVSFTGYVPQIDISRKYLYGGTSPISFDVKVFLVLETDPVTDFLNPLTRLLYLTYPHRVFNATDKVTEWITAGRDSIMQKFQEGVNEFKVSSWVLNALQALIDTFVGEVCVLGVPPPYNMWTGIAGSGLSIKYGGFVFPDIFINNMSIVSPILLYDGGYPPYLELNLSLETSRLATFDLLLSMFKGVLDDGSANYEGHRYSVAGDKFAAMLKEGGD